MTSGTVTEWKGSGPTVGPGEWLALVSVMAYTTVNALVRSVAISVDPFAASLLRQLPLTAITLVAVLWLRPGAMVDRGGRGGNGVGRRRLVMLFGAGIVSFVIGNVALLQAFAMAGLASSVIAVQGGMVIGGIALSTIALREAPRRGQLIGATVVLAGLVTAVLPTVAAGREGWQLGLGFLAALLAGTCYTVANTASRHVQRERDDAFLTALFMTNLGGVTALGLICLGRAIASGDGILAGMSGAEVLVMLGVGVANSVAIGAVTLAARFTTVTTISTMSALIIVTSMAAGVILFDEKVSVLLLIGAALIVVGVLSAQFIKPRSSSSPIPQEEVQHVRPST